MHMLNFPELYGIWSDVHGCWMCIGRAVFHTNSLPLAIAQLLAFRDDQEADDIHHARKKKDMQLSLKEFNKWAGESEEADAIIKEILNATT